jgi:hypothetical protein
MRRVNSEEHSVTSSICRTAGQDHDQARPFRRREPARLVGGPAGDRLEGCVDKTFGGESGEPGPARDLSEEERSGVSPADTEAQTQLGVGTRTRRSAEESLEVKTKGGRTSEGTKGKTEPPYGTSSAEDSTGVDPQEQVTGDPSMTPGDQAV